MDEKVTLTKEQLFKAMKLNEQSSDSTPKAKESVKLYKLSDKVVKILTDRIKDEYYAHHMYRAAANWCHDKNYKKASEFFDKEAKSELKHAEKIQKYMTDFNILPQIPKSETAFKFESLPEIIYFAYNTELGLMKQYNSDSSSVFTDDMTTFDFLTEFRQIQKDAVIEYNDLINGLDLVDKNDKFQVLYFEQTYF